MIEVMRENARSLVELDQHKSGAGQTVKRWRHRAAASGHAGGLDRTPRSRLATWVRPCLLAGCDSRGPC